MKFCLYCNRPKDKSHICDLVSLTDGRMVHNQRVEAGGDLRDSLGEELKIKGRNVTPEMRNRKNRRHEQK